MKKQLFTIYDSKSEVYLSPFTMLTAAEAVRTFTDSVNDPKTQFNKHPEDYTLFNLGTWDDNTAMVTQLTTGKQSICTAIEVINNPLLQEQQT